jgi:hypothetical protein
VLNGIKMGCRGWSWSVSVLVRSPLYVLVVAALFAVWGWAAYDWLWLPESSALVLLLGFVWLLLLAAVAVAILAFTTAGASAAASGVEQPLCLRTSLRFGWGRFAMALALAALAFLLGVAGYFCFGWLNDHALNVASFLTFHLRKPVSYVLIGRIFWTLEALFWIAIGGYLLRWLVVIWNTGWNRKKQRGRESLARPMRTATFLTGLLGAGVFGGLAWLIATWHPLVKPGFWDYMQLAVRAGVVLLLVSSAWLFCMLSLARLNLQSLGENPKATS